MNPKTMTHDEFVKLINAQMTKCQLLLASKGREYAPDADRLAAFRKAAALQKCNTAQAAFGMLAKHLVSVADMVQDPGAYRMAQWEEKLTDSINYLLILRAIIEEEAKHETH